MYRLLGTEIIEEKYIQAHRTEIIGGKYTQVAQW